MNEHIFLWFMQLAQLLCSTGCLLQIPAGSLLILFSKSDGLKNVKKATMGIRKDQLSTTGLKLTLDLERVGISFAFI